VAGSDYDGISIGQSFAVLGSRRCRDLASYGNRIASNAKDDRVLDHCDIPTIQEGAIPRRTGRMKRALLTGTEVGAAPRSI